MAKLVQQAGGGVDIEGHYGPARGQDRYQEAAQIAGGFDNPAGRDERVQEPAPVLAGRAPVQSVDAVEVVRAHRPQDPAGRGSWSRGERRGIEHLVMLVHPEPHLVVERLSERGGDEGLGAAAGRIDQGAGGLRQGSPVAPASHRGVDEDRTDPPDRAVDRGRCGAHESTVEHADQHPDGGVRELPLEVLPPLAPAARPVHSHCRLDVGRGHGADLQIGHGSPPPSTRSGPCGASTLPPGTLVALRSLPGGPRRFT